MDDAPLLDDGDDASMVESGVAGRSATVERVVLDKDHPDTHTPTHTNLGAILCKYKVHLIVMLACIITTICCCALLAPDQGNSTSTVGLTWESYFAINCVMAVVLLMLIGLPPDLILVFVSVVLTLTPCSRTQCLDNFPNSHKNGTDCSAGAWGTCTIISMSQAWKGFQSTSVLSIAVLFMVAKGVEKTGIISYLAQFVLGSPKYLWVAILRMCFPVAIISAFINDTPVVAVMMPIIESWALKTGTPVSKLMIPLSYSALLGGMCTLTGTSTNLVLQGLVKQDPNAAKDHVTVTMFEMTPVGACVAVSCIVYMAFAARCLLPNHRVDDDDAVAGGSGAADADRNKLHSFDSLPADSSTRKFVVDVRIKAKSRLIGKAVRVTELGAGGNDVIAVLGTADGGGDEVDGPAAGGGGAGGGGAGGGADGPSAATDHIIAAGDVIVLGCTTKQVLNLRTNRDVELRRQAQITETLKAGRRHRRLFEVVVAPNNPIIGSPVRDRFILSLHAAEVVAVRHSPGFGVVLVGDAPDVTANYVIQDHDTLLVESYPSFGKAFKHDSAFLSVTEIEGSTPPRNYTRGDNIRMLLSGLILVAMIVGIVLGSGFVFVWAIVAAYLLIWTHCLTVAEAYKAVKGRVILGILAAIGLGSALENTGVALAVAQGMVTVGVAIGSPLVLLSLIYYCVALLSCVAGNQATVIILYPIVSEIVVELEGALTLSQFVVVLIMGASSSFMSPFSYQTNLMVWAAGKYKFIDYPRFGGPMTVLAGIVTGVATYYIIPLSSPVK